MACGEFGLGRMAEPDDILAAVESKLAKGGPLSGRKVLITAGPTREAIDPVRYLSNRSSGKQGYALAEAAAAMGAETVLVSGPVSLPAPAGRTEDRGRKRRGNAAGGRGGTALRYRDLYRGRRRLAHRQSGEPENQAPTRPAAGIRARGEPGHSQDRRHPQVQPSCAGRRLCRRDGRGRRARHRKAQGQRLRYHRGQ